MTPYEWLLVVTFLWVVIVSALWFLDDRRFR